MSKFKKPVRNIIYDAEYIQQLVNATLVKDLQEDEEICPHCHGTGMVVVANHYGLSDDPDKTKGHFPYSHQSITFCYHCYNGVVRRCSHCGEHIKKGRISCDCESATEVRKLKKLQEIKAAFDRAPEASEEYVSKCECFYSDYYGNNDGYFFEWDDFFEYWKEHHEPNNDERPEFVWCTEPEYLTIDAHSIVESAAEDLFEDAISYIDSADIAKLQNYLYKWCDDCGLGPTYYESHKFKIRIPWEEY